MKYVILTALGVGGATVVGAALGFIFRRMSQRVGDLVIAFAAGIMLASALISLILPAVDSGGALPAVLFVVIGAIVIDLLDRTAERICLIGDEQRRCARVMLFIGAIAMHNLPEGIAAGVGFGMGESSQAIMIASGIALHNIPEGMVIIAPMIAAGVSPRRAFGIAAITGAFEVIGTLIGYFAVNLSTVILPPALALAGGMMLYIITDEMIPETHLSGHGRWASYALLLGFCALLLLGAILS